MIANTKLNDEQKRFYKELCELHEEKEGTYAQRGNVTVVRILTFPGARMAKFSVAICGDNEKKFRRKVGEYNALYRLHYAYEYVQMPEEITAEEFAMFIDGSL